MSFIIAIHVQEGLVLASDSRTTYTTTTTDGLGKEKKEMGVHISDTTYKTFFVNPNVGISTCGDGSIDNKPIAGFIEDFISLHQNDEIEIIKDSLIPYFEKIDPDLNTHFFVGGYASNGDGTKTQKLYRVFTSTKEVREINTNSQGASWDGEIDILSRLIMDVYIKENDGSYTPHINHEIMWNYMTLQDAIDFARYALQTTIDTMRFQKRVKTVGGPIDILVIKPNEYRWISRKELH